MPSLLPTGPALQVPPLPNPLGPVAGLLGQFNPFGPIVQALGAAMTAGIRNLASTMFAHMSTALVATTQVRLDGWFTGPWRAMIAVAAVFAVPILLVGVASEVLAGRPGQALRRGVLLPLAVGPVLLAARAALGLVLLVVQAACAALVQLAVGGPGGFAEALDHMRGLLGVSAGPLDPTGGGIGLLVVVLIVAVLSFVIWIELACRAALVLLLAAFVPLALAGLFWHATARWTRRLLEVLAAVVLAQLVITMVMVLAAAALADRSGGLAGGIDSVAVGLALLFLGSLGLPLTFRIIPHVTEAAAVAGGGAAVTARIRRAGSTLATGPGPGARLTAAGVAGTAPAGGARTAPAAGSAPPPSAGGSAGGAAAASPGAPAARAAQPPPAAPGGAPRASRGAGA